MRDKAAEIFVERYRAFSSQQHPRIPRNAEKNLLVLGTPKTRQGDFFEGEKNEEKEGDASYVATLDFFSWRLPEFYQLPACSLPASYHPGSVVARW